MKKLVCLLLALIIIVSCAFLVGAKQGNSNGFGEYDSVFIVGIDGAGAAFRDVETPCFDRIFSDGAVRYDAHTENITISAQNWGSILMGVSCEEHGLTNDVCETTERTSDEEYNSIFYYVREKYPESELVSFNNWSAINKGLIENDINATKINAGSDTLVTDSIVGYLNNGNKPKLMFVQLDDVDHAAHAYGGFSEGYYAAVRDADAHIGRIYDALVANGLMKNGLFIVVSDHGETYNGHGGNTPEESSAVLAVQGKTVNNITLNEDVKIRDVAAVALYALGIERPSHMTATVPGNLFADTDKSVAELCKYCGIEHKGFFDSIKCFFKRIVMFFSGIFS